MATQTPIVLPSREDVVAREATGIFGGPAGKRARTGGGGFWSPIRVLIAMTVLMTMIGWVQKSPCRSGDWGNGKEFTKVCYSDIYALYFAEGTKNGDAPYIDHAVEYPVGIGFFMNAVGTVVRVVPDSDRAKRYLDLSVFLLGLAAVVAVVATALTNRRRPWDAALIALSPSLILHLGMNWDMLAAAALALAILAWSRERVKLAGVILGVAIAIKFYPGIILFPLLFLCLRAGKLKAWLQTASLAAVTAVGIYAPFWITAPAFDENDPGKIVSPSAWQLWTHRAGLDDIWGALMPHHGGGINGAFRFFDLNTTRPADWNSFWFMLQNWRGKALDSSGSPHILNTLTLLSFILLAVAIAYVILAAPRRPRLGQVAFLALLAFMITSKVWSPQYVIWLVPLAALARPRWGAYIVWQFSEALMLCVQFWYFVHNGDSRRGVDVDWFIYTVVLRDVIILVLAGLIIREIYRPDHDIVRRDGSDDPAGGVLDGAADVAWVARLRGPVRDGVNPYPPLGTTPPPAEVVPSNA